MTKLVLSILSMLAFCSYAVAADLDAAAIRKMTINSEIERGFGAINNRCPMGEKVLNFELCAAEVMDNEKHSKMDTDAFYLGAYYREWLAIATRKDAIASVLAKGSDSIAEAEAPDVNRDADVYFKFYRKYQDRLQISDKQLCEVVHLRCEYVLPKMEVYRIGLETDK